MNKEDLIITKEEAIQSLVSNLDHIQPGEHEEFKHLYLFSNDKDLKPHIERAISHVSDSDTVQVGIIIGEGGLYSIGKELPQIDLWMMFDKDQRVIDWHQQAESILLNSDSANECRSKLLSSLHPDHFMSDWALESQQPRSLGSYFFLRNDNENQRANKFVQTTPIIRFNADIGDPRIIATIAETIKYQKGSISFANFSNILDYGQWKVTDVIRELPFHPEAFIMHSSLYVPLEEGIRINNSIRPIANHSIGIESWINNMSWLRFHEEMLQTVT